LHAAQHPNAVLHHHLFYARKLTEVPRCLHSMRPLFRYVGSKGWIADRISGCVPPGSNTVVSLFMGSGIIEYTIAAQHPDCTVICYDHDPAVVNFHQHALRARTKLYDAIMDLHDQLCNKRSRTLSKVAFTQLLNTHTAHQTRHSTIADAARFYLLTAYSYSGNVKYYAAKPKFREPNGLLQPLPTNMVVHCDDAFSVLARLVQRRVSKMFVYLDPPYLIPRNYYYAASHRSVGFDHIRLSTLLHRARFSWMLSYNDSPQVRALYPNMMMVSIPINYEVRGRHVNRNDAHRYKELVVMNSTQTYSSSILFWDR